MEMGAQVSLLSMALVDPRDYTYIDMTPYQSVIGSFSKYAWGWGEWLQVR